MVRDHLWKQNLKADGEPVLELSQRMPWLPGEDRAARRIQRCYDKLSEVWKTHWEGAVFPRARAALASAREASRPFIPWTASLSYQVTLETDTLLSIYVDAALREDAGRSMVVRAADVWDLKSGTPLAAPAFLPKGKKRRRQMVEALTAQAAARLRSGESLLYQDVERRVRAHFDPRRFYLTGREVVFFFPMLSLGSAAEGIPLFSLPGEGLSSASEAQNVTSDPALSDS